METDCLNDLFVFGNGDGTDTLVDVEIGIDRIGLVEGELTLADLTITQDSNNTHEESKIAPCSKSLLSYTAALRVASYHRT